MLAEGVLTKEEQTFRPNYRPFCDSTAATLGVRRRAGVKRLTSSFVLLGST